MDSGANLQGWQNAVLQTGLSFAGRRSKKKKKKKLRQIFEGTLKSENTLAFICLSQCCEYECMACSNADNSLNVKMALIFSLRKVVYTLHILCCRNY